MDDRAQASIAVSAEPNPLDSRCAIAGDGEHLLARKCELHKPAGDHSRGEGDQGGIGVWGALRPEATKVIEETSGIKKFAEQPCVSTRHMYATLNRRTSHRLAGLDVPGPFWMRAPGEAPGMYAGEVAMDELAAACGVDPIVLRVCNDPPVDPESGKPCSGRHPLECVRASPPPRSRTPLTTQSACATCR